MVWYTGKDASGTTFYWNEAGVPQYDRPADFDEMATWHEMEKLQRVVAAPPAAPQPAPLPAQPLEAHEAAPMVASAQLRMLAPQPAPQPMVAQAHLLTPWAAPWAAQWPAPPPAPPPPSVAPSDFDELCMKVIKAGDMTSVIDDKVRDEVRFEVAVAMVYAQMNPHIIEGGGRKKALDSNSTVQALWRRIAVECGFTEHEKPDPQGSKLTKVTKYARTILTENWIQIQLPSFRAWRGREFMTHIEGLESLIDGFDAYDPEVCFALRRLAEKCKAAASRPLCGREFMSHIESLKNLIDGFNAYDPEVCIALRRLAEKCKRAAGSDVASQPPTTVQSSAYY